MAELKNSLSKSVTLTDLNDTHESAITINYLICNGITDCLCYTVITIIRTVISRYNKPRYNEVELTHTNKLSI